MAAHPLLDHATLVPSSSHEPHVFVKDRLCPLLTIAAREVSNHISRGTVAAYVRYGVALFGAFEEVASQRRLSVSAWDPSLTSEHAWRDTFKALGCKLRYDAGLKCYFLIPPDSIRHAVVTGVSGAMYLYDAAMGAGVASCNPLRIRPQVRRREVVSRFRPDLVLGSVRTTRELADISEVLAILERFCSPTAFKVFQLMDEGLARLGEQARINVLHWQGQGWAARIRTPNKGDDYSATKEQHLSPGLHAKFLQWFDEKRPDPHGYARADYDKLAESPAGRAVMERTPLFPNAKGGFFSASGLRDYWFRRALAGRFDDVVPHSIRIRGINDFVQWIDSQPLPREEKEHAKLLFAKGLGWRAPDKMLEYYSAPTRRAEIASLMAGFAADRHARNRSFAASPEALLELARDETTADVRRRAPTGTSHADRLLALQALG